MTIAATPRPLHRSQSPLWEWVTTLDHKRIAVLYLVTTLVFLGLGGLEALALRIQLALPGERLLSPAAYNALFTMHGTTMIFLVVMPMLLGFANFLVPLMIGAHDMAFPRLNALSYWLLLFGGLLLYYSFLPGDVPNTGWFSYAPLTERPFSSSPAVDYWILALLVTSVGTVATAINLIVTIVLLRAPGMTFTRLPIFVWMCLVDAVLILGALPSLAMAQITLFLDRHYGTQFYDVAAGGDALLWQHLFWFFGHPEVYIMVLPAFGMITEIVSTFSSRPAFGYGFLVLAGIAISFLSFGVWAHHMFAVGMSPLANAFFSAASLTIAVPTGVKVFNWLATMWGGRIRFSTAMLFAIAFIPLFVIGGVTGVQFALAPADRQLTQTYYVVAHMHYVLFGGTAFAMLGGTYYWFPKITGRLLDERVGKWNFWFTFVGFNVTFLPMHLVGLMGMPRRVFTYPNLPGWAALNFTETLGSLVLAGSVLLLVWNIIASLRHGERAGANPWAGTTLEWATSSPPPRENFEVVPPVRSARPLADLAAEPVASTARQPRLPLNVPTLSAPLLGMFALIATEATFFLALLAAYVVYHHPAAGPSAGSTLRILRPALMSVALFSSSGTTLLAERRLERGDVSRFRWLLAGTLLLGIAFLLGQASEFRGLYAEHIRLGTNVFTSAFFTLLGFHGLHVIIGSTAIAVLLVLTLGWHADARPGRGAVAVIAAYWHFVDVVWLVIFVTVYVGARW